MSDKPTIDAEYEVIEGPRVLLEDLNAAPTGPLYTPEPELRGWRLWAAITVSFLIAWPAFTAFYCLVVAVAHPIRTANWISGLLGQ